MQIVFLQVFEAMIALMRHTSQKLYIYEKLVNILTQLLARDSRGAASANVLLSYLAGKILITHSRADLQQAGR